ncbi:hypothetical protein HXX76_000366 [Chlamydomonas incerta]|uniref:AMP-dependent synthetase/ligase domain-containing protein n=1 Tax=Chlamydomonas incerta TaxID=51695 RepID=A0A836B2H0_CHLIN|nr:hypothetical protein HXX76_000366 [Chlamydomonas incerta]|eukprot:KAG2445761.1 hypothetical protein HXX76_000366 [Chlamydomonas incerta]
MESSRAPDAATTPGGGGPGSPTRPQRSAASAAAAAPAPRRRYKWIYEVAPAPPPAAPGAPAAFGPAYRHVWSRRGFPQPPGGAATCWDLWANAVRDFGPAPCLGWRPATADGRAGRYTFHSYSQVDGQVAALASGLAAAGLAAGDRVGVYGVNCPEWMMAQLACNRMSYVCVPVYDTLGPDAVRYVLRHAGVRALFVARDKLAAAAAAVAAPPAAAAAAGVEGPPGCRDGAAAAAAAAAEEGAGQRHGGGREGAGGAATAAAATAAAATAAAAADGAGPGPSDHVRVSGGGGGSRDGLASFGGAADGAYGPALGAGMRLMSFGELLAAGEAAAAAAAAVGQAAGPQAAGAAAAPPPLPPVPPAPSDLATLMYTSGTTGLPKGVMLPHCALVAAVAALNASCQRFGERVGPGDRLLSYLPLAHIFDRLSEDTALAHGASVGYWFGDVERLADDAAALRPTVFIGVPRVFDRIQATVEHRLRKAGWLRRRLFTAVLRARTAALAAGALRPDEPTFRLRLWPPPLPWPLAALWRPARGGQGLAAGPGAERQPSPGEGEGEGEAQQEWEQDLVLGEEELASKQTRQAQELEQKTQEQEEGYEEEEEPEAAPPRGGGGGGGLGLELGWLDWLVFRRIKNALGGRLRLVVSGGAPLSPAVESFLRSALCCPVAQGYGLTESCAASLMQNPYSPEQAGSTGPPLLGTEMRLRSLPELGYLAAGGGAACALPAGELLLRGPQMFTGYYRRPDLTAEAFIADPTGAAAGAEPDGDGGSDGGGGGGRWFCTGDVAALRPDGSVAIIDRVKSMFKLAQGEYISPERVEGVLAAAPVVEQVWVTGDSCRHQLLAVVVPHKHKLLAMAGEVRILPPAHPRALHPQHHDSHQHLPPPLTKEQQQQHEPVAAAPAGPEAAAPAAASAPPPPPPPPGSPRAVLADPDSAPTLVATLCGCPAVRRAVLQQLQAAGRAAGLRGFELPAAVHLTAEPFSPEGGLLTPTLKLRRPALARRFGPALAQLYAELGEE